MNNFSHYNSIPSDFRPEKGNLYQLATFFVHISGVWVVNHEFDGISGARFGMGTFTAQWNTIPSPKLVKLDSSQKANGHYFLILWNMQVCKIHSNCVMIFRSSISSLSMIVFVFECVFYFVFAWQPHADTIFSECAASATGAYRYSPWQSHQPIYTSARLYVCYFCIWQTREILDNETWRFDIEHEII